MMLEMSFVLSYIVPCYNVEKYIQQCLDSIYACDMPEEQFEVVCINDCSPDNVQEILERNREGHDNLRIVVHEQNKGLGGARNTGIREARGSYLWFVDSDDEIVGEGIGDALKKAVDEELDVLCFNYCRIDDEGKRLPMHKVFKEFSFTDGYSFAKKAVPHGLANHMGFVWRFLYRTEFLRNNGLFFPEQVHWEDTVFMPKSILLAKRVASVSQVFYAYRFNPDSISGVFGKSYPAKSIYEFAFCAGGDLLRFSEEVKDDALKQAFKDSAINKYINGFSIHLFRTGKKERNQFFMILRERKDGIKYLKPQISLLNRMLLIPCLGPLITEMVSFGYKKKHK